MGLEHELETTEPRQRIFKVEAHPIEIGARSGGWVLVIREITHQREIQQRAQQQERLAAVGQLAAGIADDFNNILTGMIGFAELARQAPNLSHAIRGDLERIGQQGMRAAHLIRQILDFSRQTIAEKQSLDLVPLIKEII